jgi:hypothetical protein
MEQLPSDKLTVEFYPSVDDYVHIALRVSGSARPSTLTAYAYYAFLLVNLIAFPVFLSYVDYPITAFAVFTVNTAALLLLIPRVNKSSFEEYYSQIIGDREKAVARVVLSIEGVRYTADGGEFFMPWDRITEIEDTPDAIYLYFPGNGFGVRKTGFAYVEDEKYFLQSARQLHRANRLELTE